MKTFSILILALSIGVLAYPQDSDNDKTLSTAYQIVVTASKTDVPLENTTRDVIVISHEEINEAHSNTLIELL